MYRTGRITFEGNIFDGESKEFKFVVLSNEMTVRLEKKMFPKMDQCHAIQLKETENTR